MKNNDILIFKLDTEFKNHTHTDNFQKSPTIYKTLTYVWGFLKIISVGVGAKYIQKGISDNKFWADDVWVRLSRFFVGVGSKFTAFLFKNCRSESAVKIVIPIYFEVV